MNKNIFLKNIFSASLLALLILVATLMMEWVRVNHFTLQLSYNITNPLYYWPLIAIWISLSLILYFLYQAITNTYSHFKDWLIYEFTYTKNGKKEDFELKKHKALFILLISIAYYFLVVTFMVFAIYPLTKIVTETFAISDGNTMLARLLNLLPTYLVWLLSILIFEVGMDFFKAEEREMMLAEEHGLM